MASDEASGSKPAPVVLRIKLRYEDVEAMVHRFAPNVGKSGLFLPTKSLQPIGAEVKFELRIADDTSVLVGLGRVKAARAPDPAAPKAAFGMAIELMRVTRESREVILKMLERRRQMGLPEVGIPMPADIDAARGGSVDTQVRDTTSAPVPAPAPPIDSGPSESLLTAPRRASGPLAVAKISVVEALAPEPPRRRRPAIHEVIESASGPIVSVVSVPGLDDDVDVAAVLLRARALAGGGTMDAELEALLEVAAAPLEISIEAASAELARQLGGKAVAKRDRSQRWAPPPKIEAKAEPAPEPEPPPPVVAKPQIQIVSEPAIVLDLPPAPDEPTPVEAPPEAVTAVEEAPQPHATDPGAAHPTLFEDDEESAPVHTAPGMIHDDADPRAFAEPEPAQDEGEDEEVAPEQIADEIHTLGDGDLEEVEHTAIGAMPEAEPEPEPDAFAQHAYPTEPAVAAELARSLDAQLAEAEEEAEHDDLGISGAYAMPQEVAPPYIEPLDDVPQEAESEEQVPDEEELEEIDEFEILAEADADDEDLIAARGEQDASRDLAIAQAAPEPYYAPPAEAPLHLDDDDPEGEFEERPVHRVPRPSQRLLTPEPRPSQSDFVSRLDLSDEFEAAPPASLAESLAEIDPRHGALDPREVSAGHALAQFEHDEHGSFDRPVSYDGSSDGLDRDSQYTVAERTPPADLDFDAPHAAYPRAESLPGFDKSDVIANRAPPRRAAREAEPSRVTPAPVRKRTTGNVPLATAPPGPAAGDEGYDLETALEALDVDLDDLSVPHTQPPGARLTPAPRPATKVPKRATTDDGVLIDFDDDE